MGLNATAIMEEGMEKPPLSEEEAMATLKPKPFPSYAAKLFGAGNMQEFAAILTHPHSIELDKLLLMGDISREEFLSYAMMIPDFNIVRARFIGLAKKIATTLRPKLRPGYLSPGKRDGKKGIIKLYSSIEELCNSQRYIGAQGFMVSRLAEFESALYIYLTAEVLAEVSAQPHYAEQVGKVIGFLDGEFIAKKGQSFPGNLFLNFHNRLRTSIYSDSKSANAWRGLINHETPLKSEEQLRAENQVLTDRVERLSDQRTIAPFSIDMGPVKIAFEGNEAAWAQDRMSSHSLIAIVLDPSKGYKPVEEEKGGRGYTIVFTGRKDIIYLDFDRALGELVFPETGFSIREYFSPQAYEILKNIVLKALYGHLSSKEDNILLPETKELVSVVAEEAQKTGRAALDASGQKEGSTAENTAEPKATPGHTPSPTWKHIPYQPPETSQNDDSEKTVASTDGPEKTLNPTKASLSALKPAKVVAVLTRIFGEPRVSGNNHRVFTRSDGRGVVVSTHYKEIGARLLKRILNQAGITPKKFLEHM